MARQDAGGLDRRMADRLFPSAGILVGRKRADRPRAQIQAGADLGEASRRRRCSPGATRCTSGWCRSRESPIA
jgi:hypothetical protein